MHFHLRDFPVVFTSGITQTISLKNVALHNAERLFRLWKQHPRRKIDLIVQLRDSTATNPITHLQQREFIKTASTGLQHVEPKHQRAPLFFSLCSNGLNGTISIYPLEGPMAGMMPTAASSNSPTPFTILDVDQKAYLFVGGIFGTVKVLVCHTVCVKQHHKPVIAHDCSVPSSFRKLMLWDRRRSLAAWGRHSWMVNPSACGTIERDRETVKDVLSGITSTSFFIVSCCNWYYCHAYIGCWTKQRWHTTFSFLLLITFICYVLLLVSLLFECINFFMILETLGWETLF